MKKTKKYRKSIENKIKRANFKEALNELEDFIKVINDKDLNIQILTLHARFNTEFKRYLNGLTKDSEEQNKIIYALIYLLEEAEEIAKEKISKIEEEKYFHRDYRNLLIDEFKKYLDERERKLLNQEINYDSLTEFLYSRFPGYSLVKTFGFIETFPQLLNEFGYKAITELQDLLDRTEEARLKFNIEETFGKSAVRELFIALGMVHDEAIKEFALEKDIELIKKYRYLIKRKINKNVVANFVQPPTIEVIKQLVDKEIMNEEGMGSGSPYFKFIRLQNLLTKDETVSFLQDVLTKDETERLQNHLSV